MRSPLEKRLAPVLKRLILSNGRDRDMGNITAGDIEILAHLRDDDWPEVVREILGWRWAVLFDHAWKNHRNEIVEAVIAFTHPTKKRDRQRLCSA